MADKTEKSDKPEDKRALKDVLRQLAEDSSLHGVPKIVSSRQIPVKILWCMLFLTTFIVLMIQIHSLFVTFHAYPIQTSVSLEFSPLSFPAITVCNMNPVRRSEVNMSQPIKDIIYPKVKKKKTGEETSRKKREAQDDIHKLQQQKEPIRQQGQTRKRVREDNHDEIQSHANVMLQSQGDVQSRTNNMDYEGIEDLLVHFHQEELLERIRRDASSPVMASSTVAVASSSSIEPTASDTVVPTVSSGQTAGSQPVSSSVVASDSYSTGSSSYYYEYDYWGNFWDYTSYSTSDYSSDSYYQEWAEWYSRYYSSGSNSDYYDGTSYSTGYETFLFDQYFSQKDKWDERIINFQTVFKNESTSAKTSKVYQEWAEWYSRYYSSGSNSDYYDSTSYSTGYETFLFDQYFSQKDKWDERIINFQTVFKNESTKTRQKMGHKKEDVIVGATFVRSVQNITNFHEFTTPEYGNCYTMTSPKYKAWRSGPAHGIKLTLNLEVNEYIENFATGYGIRIVFHAPGTYPLASEEGLTLSPGYETSVGLRMVQITRLGDPYGECSDGSKFFKQYGIKYSTAACMQFCRVRKAIEVCKCIPHDAPDIDFYTGVQVCKNSGSDKLCTIQVDVKFDDGSYQAECDCKSPCHEIVYEKTMSGRRWPNDDYLKNVLLSNACSMNISSLTVACGHLQNNTFDFEMSEKYRNNFLQVLIYFEDLNYESISQEPLYESVRFLSDIGGAMGLFLGASMLSFVEFLQLGLELGLYAWKKFVGCQQISPNQSENYTTSDKSGMKTPVSLIDPDLNMDKEMKI